MLEGFTLLLVILDQGFQTLAFLVLQLVILLGQHLFLGLPFPLVVLYLVEKHLAYLRNMQTR